MSTHVLHLISLSSLVLIIAISVTKSARILILQGPGEGSHYFTATAIGEVLVKRGHQVTILLSDLYAYRANATKDAQLYNFELYQSSMTAETRDELYTAMNRAAFKKCENILKDVTLLSKLTMIDFDLILVDMIFNCPVLVAQYLDKPFVYFVASSMVPHPFSFRNRLPINPAYIPEMLTGFDHRMPFMNRLKNTINTGIGMMLCNLVLDPYEQIKKVYKIKPEVSMYDALGEGELWFLHTNFALDFPRPLMPNVIPVGGLTTKPAQPLNDTYVMSMDNDVASMFAKAFRALPQKVIWKLGGNLAQELPDNVKVMEWIPQNDILGHKKVKAFVMHCGINGVYEALYHAVPLVCLPLFGDQFDIAARVASKEIGIQLDVSTLESSVLATHIRDVIEDQRFKDNMNKFSYIFRDAQQHPAEVGADWMEYVLRHGGARHLRSAALDLDTYQYLLIDVLITVCIGSIIVLFILITLCKFCLRKCMSSCAGSKSKRD
ncbi:2-hydroxyacylsphingosine 1-beta-galactosyltransferase-like [Amphiura filiformis]|uniref:2-hydroxyacylsphingosine 1-beta-galactosyltransferase-like n=1 Tax=Amphiura filiformis TaxID=82378 RepID=UPI003B228F23